VSKSNSKNTTFFVVIYVSENSSFVSTDYRAKNNTYENFLQKLLSLVGETDDFSIPLREYRPNAIIFRMH